MDSALQGAQLVTPRKNAWILRVSGAPKVPKPRKFLETCRPSPVPPLGAVMGASICKTVETAAPVFAPAALPCVPARTGAHALEPISRVENRRHRTRHYVRFRDPPTAYRVLQCVQSNCHRRGDGSRGFVKMGLVCRREHRFRERREPRRGRQRSNK